MCIRGRSEVLMTTRPALIRSLRTVPLAAALVTAILGDGVRAAPVTLPLDAIADLTSNFITYWSEGIAQLNLTFPNTTRQPFWNTNDLSQTYNSSFDFFPNDRAM